MAQSNKYNQSPEWLKSLLSSMGIHFDTDASSVFKQMDDVASSLAPNMRRLWKWIFLIEGIAVILPLLWLIIIRLGWTPTYTAIATAICIFTVLFIFWWLRWHRTQHTWARTRLIAEIMRSMQATSGISNNVTSDALTSSPMLQAIAQQLPSFFNKKNNKLSEFKNTYLKERISGQKDYYINKKNIAVRQRKHLSQYVTWSLDGALFLAIASLILVLSGSGAQFIRLSGVDYVLGFMGSFLPLLAILIQTLTSYLELNRNTGLYTKQIDFLENYEQKFISAQSSEDIILIVQEVERVLLDEVVVWFYETEHTESFYRSKSKNEIPKNEVTKKISFKTNSQKNSFSQKIQSTLLKGGSFIFGVVFGRVLIVAFSMIMTTALIAYYTPTDIKEFSTLRKGDGQLLSSPSSSSWNPSSNTENGFILIAHGLHDGVAVMDPQNLSEKHWMGQMQTRINDKLASEQPDICLVDWSAAAASPTEHKQKNNDQGGFITTIDWLSDISAIRPKGEYIGKLVGFKIAMAIQDGIIKKDKPMHFIGHSAGGFVVLHAALVLQKLNMVSNNLHITLLDTPIPDVNDIKKVSQKSIVDFYSSSTLSKVIVPDSDISSLYTLINIDTPKDLDTIAAHSYAHTWFINSIQNNDKNGFLRSPFSNK